MPFRSGLPKEAGMRHVVALVLVLAVGLVGCGKNNKRSTASTSSRSPY